MISLIGSVVVILLQLEGGVAFWIADNEIGPLDVPQGNDNVCKSQECRDAAESLLRNLNTSANPCTEFFNFACGGWSRDHPVPKTDSHWNQFNQADHLLTVQIKDLLEEESNEDEPGPVKDAKRQYAACLKTVDEDESLRNLLEVGKVYGGWPMTVRHWKGSDFHWQNMLADLIRDFSVSPITSVYVYVDRKQSNRSVLTVDQGGLTLPRAMLVDAVAYSQQRATYRQWMFQTASLLASFQGHNIPDDLLYLQVDEVIALEVAIAKLCSPMEMRRNVVRTYNPMTLRELQDWTDLASLNHVNWLSLIRRLLTDTGLSVDWSEKLIVREVDYIFKVTQLLSQTPLKVISNYFHWRLVKSLGPEISPPLRRLAFQFEQVFTGATLEQPRWKDCITSVTSALGMAVGYSYVKAHFDHRAKRVAEEMTSRIKQVLSEEISHLKWMDSETRTAAKRKVNQMSQLIGFPTWITNYTALEHHYIGLNTSDSHWLNVLDSRRYSGRKMFQKLREPVDREEWPIPPAVVNAYYNPQGNSIIFPAGILQPPFFKKGRLEALNFGGIGVVVGHEITHGFDDVGRQSDGEGNLLQWWSEKTIEEYENIADCFISQYSRFRLPELDLDLLRPVTVNGAMTQGENMADNGGLRLALLAYRRFLAETGPEPLLPGLEHFTSEQLFFIAFATNWCESSTKESLLQEILSDPHSPHKFRVEGTLSNSAEFAAAFGCPLPSKTSSCSIW